MAYHGLFDKLKSPKTWAPLVASGALLYGVYSGVEPTAEGQEAVVLGLTNLWGFLHEAMLAGAGLLTLVGLRSASKL